MKKTFFTLLVVLIAATFGLQGCKEKPERSITLTSARSQVRNFGRLLSNQTDISTRDSGRIRSFYYSAEFFSKKDLKIILSESGCEGIRVYHALNDSGRSVMYIVGVNSKTGDLLPDSAINANAQMASATYDAENHIITSDGTLRCPSMCDLGLAENTPPAGTTDAALADTTVKAKKDTLKNSTKQLKNNKPDSSKKL